MTPPRAWRWWVLGVLVGLGAAVVGVAALWSVPWYTISPGSVWATEELITVEGGDRFPSEGEIGFTTVSLSPRRTSALEYWLGRLDPAVETISEADFLGDQTPEENRERNRQFMDDSKQLATAVAFETLGHDVAVPYGARVLQVDPAFPGDEVLDPGDLIVAAEGEEVETWDELVEILEPLDVGDEVTLEIIPAPDDPDEPLVTEDEVDDAERETVTSRLAEFDDPDDDEPPRAILGIIGDTAVSFDFPYEVTIDSGAVGGPSAGLAFTLAILDVLTPEDLTGGELIATTGTIALDGTVGPVGGVEQKVYAARRAGVELFLVPADEYDRAKAAAGDMRVEAVEDLDDALAALGTVGGDVQALRARAEQLG